MEMFAASVQEELYDSDRWGQFYRPNGMRFDNVGSSDNAETVAATPVAKPVTASSIMDRVATKAAPAVEAPWDVDPPKAAAPAADKPKMSSPDEILAAIRARKMGNQS